jgi:hypothetical protein
MQTQIGIHTNIGTNMHVIKGVQVQERRCDPYPFPFTTIFHLHRDGRSDLCEIAGCLAKQRVHYNQQKQTNKKQDEEGDAERKSLFSPAK